MNAKPPASGPSSPDAPGRDAGPRGESPVPEAAAGELPPAGSFDALGLPPELLRTMTDLGVTDPFPIQAATLPNALAGRDVLGRARTGRARRWRSGSRCSSARRGCGRSRSVRSPWSWCRPGNSRSR